MNLAAARDRTPPVVRNLAGRGWDRQNESFRRRVLTAAPLGSPEDRLTSYLRAQGFHPAWKPATGPEREAEASWTDFPCLMLAKVSWRVDGSGRVQAVSTFHHEIGCL